MLAYNSTACSSGISLQTQELLWRAYVAAVVAAIPVLVGLVAAGLDRKEARGEGELLPKGLPALAQAEAEAEWVADEEARPLDCYYFVSVAVFGHVSQTAAGSR